MVNKQLIYKKLSELDQKLELLKKYQGVTENELENNLEAVATHSRDFSHELVATYV